MPSASGTSIAQNAGYTPHKWFFTKEEMRRTQSISEGFTEEKELHFRQLATRFIQVMVERLNEAFKDRMGAISQYCMCAATIHMHRFYYFHSFKTFDYRDIAAACLFLSGKSEESPRKLEDIVKVWWEKKYPKHIYIPTQHILDAKAYIVQLENIILHTIAFDLQVDLPHPIVLRMMHENIGQAINDHGNKKLTKCAYFFATDVLCVTNWAIRYSAAAIAICCVHIVCAWCRHEIPKAPDGTPWFSKADPTMTEAILKEMADEFVQIYHSCKDKLALTSKFLSHNSGPFPTPGVPSSMVSVSPTPLVEPLPPPPQPPSLPRKVDFNEYKERAKLTPKEGEKGILVDKPRKSFIPDTSQVGKHRELPNITLPGMEPLPKDSNVKRDDDRRRDREKDKEREKRDKERRRDDKTDERRREEEKRKREHERSSGHSKDNYSHSSYKKPRQDGLPSSHHSVNTNGYHKGQQMVQSRVPNDKPLSSVQHPIMPRPASLISPPRTSLTYETPVALSPPPPAPSLVPPPPPPPTRNELEDGEVDE